MEIKFNIFSVFDLLKVASTIQDFHFSNGDTSSINNYWMQITTMTKKECTLEAEVLVDLDHGSTPFDIFQTVTGINEFLEIIVMETNRYTTQKGCSFEPTEDEIRHSFG